MITPGSNRAGAVSRKAWGLSSYAAALAAVVLGVSVTSARPDNEEIPADHMAAVPPDLQLSPSASSAAAQTRGVVDTLSRGPGNRPPYAVTDSYVTTEGIELAVAPPGLLYKNYLAGVHEPRLSIVSAYERELEWIWEASLGGHVGLLRYGTPGAVGVEGFQIDVEGAVFSRLDQNQQLVATDFRIGVPLTYAAGRYQTKFGYYHVSSHLGDEFLLLTGFPRINYARDSIVWGHAWQMRPALRLYVEAAYSFSTEGGAEPWQFQFGFDYSPAVANCCGAPFFAVNGHLREEVDFGGNLVVECGWAWRGYTGHLLRTGVYYYNGKSSQFEFFNFFEQQIGFGLWYDF